MSHFPQKIRRRSIRKGYSSTPRLNQGPDDVTSGLGCLFACMNQPRYARRPDLPPPRGSCFGPVVALYNLLGVRGCASPRTQAISTALIQAGTKRLEGASHELAG